MEIKRVNILRGPNIWTNYKTLEAWVDIGKFEDFPSHTIPGFPERIMAWLPTMLEHRCGIGERGGFFQRLVTGTYLGHILEHITLELQSLAGVTVDFGRARETSERGVYKVAVEFVEPEVAIVAMQAARSLIMAAVEDEPFDVAGAVKQIRETADRVCLGPGTGAIVKAAEARGIPTIRLNSGSLVQLGYCSAQKRIWTAETDSTSAVAESIAQDKQLTGSLLRSLGIPVPEGRTVDSPEAAIEFAESEGYPIVIKPLDGNHGRGVSVNLRDGAAVRAAFDLASKEGSAVVAEQMIPGIQHRVLVVASKVVAVGRADPDRVLGDGTHTVAELVAIANQDPRRGTDGGYPLSRLELDALALNVLKQQGMTPESVPASGLHVVLNYNGDCSIDVTDQIHPEVAEQCVLAAQAVGLNIAGIDLLVEDIGRPLSGQRGAVIEVNASPSLVMHVKPVHGTPRPVGQAIVSSLFQDSDTGRVPIVAVTGTNGKTATVDLLEQILIAADNRVGVASSDSTRANGRTLSRIDSADFDGSRRVLVNPFVDSAILEVGATSVLNQGLGFDQCDVAVVTNLGSGDHLGAKYVETLEVMTKVKRAPIDVVLPNGTAVLNANDNVIAGLAQYCPGRTVYFSTSLDTPAALGLIQAGAEVLTVHGPDVAACRAERSTPIIPAEAVTQLCQGHATFQLENALAAIAAARALGISPNLIREGLTKAAENVCSRFACFTLSGAIVVVSMCRNLSALEATLGAIPPMMGSGIRKAIYAVYADQTLSAVREQGAALGCYFDEVICRYGNAQSPDAQYLIDQFVQSVRSTPRHCTATAALEAINEELLVTQLQKLDIGQILLVQAWGLDAFRRTETIIQSTGASRATDWPTITPANSSFTRESRGASTQSNNA
jgi:cyanophycin synthetase